jgi:hypothetical protein
MEFKDINSIIFSKFYKEWEWTNNPIWKTFIDSRNLGIEFFQVDAAFVDCYRVNDEKKWALTRIKYGI